MNFGAMLDAVKTFPEGDYAECGVYQGESAARIAANMNPDARLWLFDSFVGHAEPSEFDNERTHPKGRYADTSYEQVRKRCPHAVIVPGFVPASFVLARSGKFRFVHIDLDHYLPTKGACSFFKERMVPGGIICFDDYTSSDCPGAAKAIDEIFGRENVLSKDCRWIFVDNAVSVSG